METTMSYTAGQGGGRSPHGSANGVVPVERKGTSIDSASERIRSLTSAIHHITNRVAQVADSTTGPAPAPTPANKIDHPPSSLQEHITYLEAAVTELDNQVQRFF
jgi:hypothetical protein